MYTHITYIIRIITNFFKILPHSKMHTLFVWEKHCLNQHNQYNRRFKGNCCKWPERQGELTCAVSCISTLTSQLLFSQHPVQMLKSWTGYQKWLTRAREVFSYLCLIDKKHAPCRLGASYPNISLLKNSTLRFTEIKLINLKAVSGWCFVSYLISVLRELWIGKFSDVTVWGRGRGRETQGTTLSICLLKFILIHCLPLLIQPTPSSFQSLQHFALGRTAGLEQKKKIKIGINSLVRTKEERKTEDGQRKWRDLSLGSPRKSCLTRAKVEIMACGTHKPPSHLIVDL